MSGSKGWAAILTRLWAVCRHSFDSLLLKVAQVRGDVPKGVFKKKKENRAKAESKVRDR